MIKVSQDRPRKKQELMWKIRFCVKSNPSSVSCNISLVEKWMNINPKIPTDVMRIFIHVILIETSRWFGGLFLEISKVQQEKTGVSRISGYLRINLKDCFVPILDIRTLND